MIYQVWLILNFPENLVAAHPAGKKKSPVGVTRKGAVYELFLTNLPQQAFTASDVAELYLRRGAFEPTFSDEDKEIDPNRECSHSAWGQEAWRSSANEPGISAWTWGISWSQYHSASPSSSLPSCLNTSKLPHVQPQSLLPLYTAHKPLPRPGRRDALPEPIFLSSPMGYFNALQGTHSLLMSGVAKLMAACGWCMEPSFAVVTIARGAGNVNGKATIRASRAK